MGDGQPHMTKSAPCYSVSWDLGELGLDPRIPAHVAPGPSPQSQQLDHLIPALPGLLCRLILDCTQTPALPLLSQEILSHAWSSWFNNLEED